MTTTDSHGLSQNALIPFFFEGLQIKEAYWIDNEPYFTRLAIGEFLEYTDPQKAIDNIIDRNPHILQFSLPLNMRVHLNSEKLGQYVKNIEVQAVR